MSYDSSINDSPQQEQEDNIDIRELVNRFFTLWPWALLSCIVLFVGAVLYLYITPSSYHVNASVLIKQSDGPIGQSATVNSTMLQSLGLMTGPSNVNNELQIIKSYPLMNEVVHEMQLNVNYYTEDGIRTRQLYKNQLPFQAEFIQFRTDSLKAIGQLAYKMSIKKDKTGFQISNEETGESLTGAWYDTLQLKAGSVTFVPNHQFDGKENNEYSFTVIAPTLATSSYLEKLKLKVPDDKASVIGLSLDANIPQKGEDILNALIQTYIQSKIRDNNRIADSTISFIDSRLVIVNEELTNVEKKIQEFKQSNSIANIDAQSESLIQSVQDYAQKVSEQKIQLSVINSLQDYLKKNEGNPRIVPTSLMIENETLSNIISQYNDLLLQRSRVLLNATEDNPMVKNLDEQIKHLRGNLVRGIASVKKSAQAALQSINDQQLLLQGQIKKVPARERVFLDYSRKQEVRQQLYLFLLKKREEVAISKSSSLANINIINSAMADTHPFSPKSKIVFLAALILGCALPFGYSYLKGMLNVKIGSRKDIENETPLPIVGEIGHKKQDNRVVVRHKSRTIISEQFRSLRTNLQFLLADEQQKTVMTTSSMGGEGKSFVTLNLAMALAITGKKVVLMEMDLRKPKIAQPLGLKVKKGISGYVIGQAEKSEIIYPSGLSDQLDIIPAGAIPPNPVELLLHDRTQELMEYLKANYDYIFIDAPPMLVTDAQIMSKYADTTLYIVRLGKTHKDQLRIPEHLRRSKKIPNLNIVVNDIVKKRFRGGYYGYGQGNGYGYGYGYGDYINEEEDGKKGWFSR